MVLVVTTSALRGARYLRALIAQVEREIADGWKGRPLIVSDGPPPFDSGWRTDASAAPGGQKHTYWRALASGVEHACHAGTQQFLILEDDVELCRNALRYIAGVTVPAEFAFLSWFDGHAVPAGTEPGIHAAPAGRFICLQAVTWTLATAATLLASRRAATWSEPHRGDLLVASILARRRYGVHVPNLVEHRGVESLCSPGQRLAGIRVAANYPGATFDAMK
jgi:hypothetical protein